MKNLFTNRERTKIHFPTFLKSFVVGGLTLMSVSLHAQSVVAAKDSTAWINVSESLGFPLGGVGTGYSAFGKYGFVRVNFEGKSRDGMSDGQWEYNIDQIRKTDLSFSKIEQELNDAKNAATPVPARTLTRLQQRYDRALKVHNMATAPEGFLQSSYGFTIADGEDNYIVQTTPVTWKKGAIPFETAKISAFLPKGNAVFSDKDANLKVSINAFSPMIPRDLVNSTLPVQVFNVTVSNTGNTPRLLDLSLENSVSGTAANDRTVFTDSKGEIVFAANEGVASDKAVTVKLSLAPGSEITKRFYVAWYYPVVDKYKRYYTLASPNASAVVDKAMKSATEWNTRIDAWHNSIQAPAYLKRIWFGSLSSIMTSSIMTADPYFFEIETPHPMLNTMDVLVYSNWVYMINWPELEKMDMSQYFKATQTSGPNTGLILHSLWDDAAHYVEEPTFMCRMRRDALWYNDPTFTRKGFDISVLAANRVYNLDNYEGLIQSKHGNQSYDIWKMPGVSSYVNSAWIYGLDALKSMANGLGEKNVTVGNLPINDWYVKARASYDKLLWNGQSKSWNLFYRTEGASQESTPETLFTDQLFGLWVAAIDKKAKDVLPADKINMALHSLYTNNVMEDKAQGFRGWVNGMKPNRVPDVTTGYHSRTCWFGSQINLSSLLGFVGDEPAALDIMKSMDMSLKNNHFAAGEWNGSINAKSEVLPLPEETCKDTPRFAPYPRYKSSWEYVVRLLGLQMDEQSLYLQPFKTVDFRFDDIELAGKKMNITVEAGWNRVLVDGKKAKMPLVIPRTKEAIIVQFLK
jgi:uncharacterized protein (DUF608 family)